MLVPLPTPFAGERAAAGRRVVASFGSSDSRGAGAGGGDTTAAGVGATTGAATSAEAGWVRGAWGGGDDVVT